MLQCTSVSFFQGKGAFGEFVGSNIMRIHSNAREGSTGRDAFTPVKESQHGVPAPSLSLHKDK